MDFLAEEVGLRESVLYQAPGVLELSIRESIRDTVIDLCRRAQVWQEDISATVRPFADSTFASWGRILYFSRLQADLDRSQYFIVVPEGGAEVDDVLYILGSREGADEFTPMPSASLDNLYRDPPDSVSDVHWVHIPVSSLQPTDVPSIPQDDLNALTGEFRTIERGDMSELRLSPAPLETLDLVLRVSLCPNVLDVGAPKTLLRRHREAIVLGALHRLLRMPYRDWTNKRAATEYEAQYEDALVRARTRASGRLSGQVSKLRYGGLPFTMQSRFFGKPTGRWLRRRGIW